jgi:tetratricopeptide (TPR) repeat protein/uncharacterized membrane protein
MEAGWLAAVIVTPLFFNVWSNRVFEPDKLALLRSIALGILAAALIRMLERGLPSRAAMADWLRRPLVRPLLFVTASFLLSSSLSITPRLSFWGSYVRMQGFYTWLAYVVVFLAIVSCLRSRRQVERLQMALILPSLPVALYGVVQKYGADPMPWLGDVTQRVASTMGNSIFVAAYLILVLPLTLARLLQALRQLDQADEAAAGGAVNAAVLRVAGYLVLVAVQFGAIVLSGSRGPWIGAIGSLVFLSVLLGTVYGGRRLILGVTGFWLAVGLFLVAFNLPGSPLEPLREVQYIGRLGKIFETESGTGKVRVLIWGGAVELIGSDPFRAVVGWGPESMHVAYNPFYPPELGNYEARNASPDRSHNETFDTLVQMGALGLVAYLWLFTSLFRHGLEQLGLIAGTGDRRRFLAFWLGGGTAAALGFRLWSGDWNFFGVALPAGMIAGLLGFVVLRALRGFEADDRPGKLLVIALLAGLIAHFIEIHFGIAIAATRTLFFVMTAALVALGLPEVEEEGQLEAPAVVETGRKRRRRAARPERQTSTGSSLTWISAGCLMLAIMLTLLFDFIVDPSLGGSNLLILIWLVGLSWAIGTLILGTETYLSLAAERVPGGGRVGLGAYLVLTLGFSLAYAFSHWMMLAAERGPGSGGAETSSAMITMFYLALFLLILGWAWSLMLGSRSPGRVSLRGVAFWWAYPLVGVLAVAAAFLTNLNKVRADVYYKQAWAGFHAQAGVEPDYEQALRLYNAADEDYDRALQLDPGEDYYMLFKGKALLEKAAREASAFEQRHAASIAENPTLSEYGGELAADAQARDAMFDDAIRELEVALAEAPHNPDHTANLARAYQIWGDSSFDTAKRAERLAESRRWFERVIAPDLSPRNAGLREELATTDFLAGDIEAAMQRIDEALEIDPQYTRPYRLRARIHREAREYDEAAADYLLYLESKDGRRDISGWSELAWVYGQSGDLPKAKEANERALELSRRYEDAPDVTTLGNLAILARDMKDPDGACAYVSEGLSYNPTDPTLNNLNETIGCGVELPEPGLSGPGADTPVLDAPAPSAP